MTAPKDYCACGHHREAHSGGSVVLGNCWAPECICEGDGVWVAKSCTCNAWRVPGMSHAENCEAAR